MENKLKRYLDKVIEHLLRDTKIDYEKKEISYFFSCRLHSVLHGLPSLYSFPDFSNFCKNTFGLTEEEIIYVWEIYINIIKNKIENGEQ